LKAYLSYNPPNSIAQITISGSKSESNRLLILKALYPNISINNLSNSDDTNSLLKAIGKLKGTVDVHHAGTAMRFLAAYFASKKSTDVILTGSKRMQERPIKVLVDALITLGAEIDYLEEKGFPPIRIKGKQLEVSSVNLAANISSQYISALMLIAPSLPKGLIINLDGEITSTPYIQMTLDLLKNSGVYGSFKAQKISIPYIEKIEDITINVESDWSAASYYYSIVALSENSEIILKNLSENSLQGDSEVASIYRKLGVETLFNSTENSIHLKKRNTSISDKINLNLNKTPDIAQTIAVTCFGLGISCKLEGLKTLKIKETDRLQALKTELEKLGAAIKITEDSLEIIDSKKIISEVVINTYQDHRMAMAFAPLIIKIPIIINEPEVVTKSYLSFWKDLYKVGIQAEIK